MKPGRIMACCYAEPAEFVVIDKYGQVVCSSYLLLSHIRVIVLLCVLTLLGMCADRYGEVIGFKSMYLRVSRNHNNMLIDFREAEMEVLRNFIREMLPEVIVVGGDRYFLD